MKAYYAGESFDWIVRQLTRDLYMAPDVKVGEWQAIQGDIPQGDTIEVEDVSFEVRIPTTQKGWANESMPNLPWAEDHFQERVGGLPLNPPPSSAWWPFATANNDEFKKDEQFSHTYPERMWPMWANGADTARYGIRGFYGDLKDVVELLQNRPGTRQAYLPIWFPEDTGAITNQRVPCTLGYHFLVRNGRLKIVYYIRSCDFYRHFNDDVYMAGRLAQWVADQLPGVLVSKLVMHISSLHVFSVERNRLGTDLKTYAG